MNRNRHKTTTLAGLGAALLGGSLLSSPAFAMTELSQGYALGAATPQDASVPPPPAAQQDQEKQQRQDAQDAAEPHKHAEGKCGGEAGKTDKSAQDKHETHGAEADKTMGEGKCGEGKCGGAA